MQKGVQGKLDFFFRPQMFKIEGPLLEAPSPRKTAVGVALRAMPSLVNKAGGVSNSHGTVTCARPACPPIKREQWGSID